MLRTVSVCIPTCDRPKLLREAVLSCAAQTRRPDEILVGDDSSSGATEGLMAALQAECPVPIRYTRNAPRLRQNANINSLFVAATTTHLILLHDDDLLLPNAVEDLLTCFDAEPEIVAAYGKQIMISESGVEDMKDTEWLNRTYGRVPEKAGVQPYAWEAALSQQFPNNGFLILTPVAQSILWRSLEEVGNAGDFDFGLRLGMMTGAKLYFKDVFTSKLRRTGAESISGSPTDDAALTSHFLLQSFELPPEAAASRDAKLTRSAPVAMMQALQLRKKREAWEIYKSPYHPWRRRLSLGGVRRLMMLLRP